MAKANRKFGNAAYRRFFEIGLQYVHRPKQIRLANLAQKQRKRKETKAINEARFNRVGKKGRYC